MPDLDSWEAFGNSPGQLVHLCALFFQDVSHIFRCIIDHSINQYCIVVVLIIIPVMQYLLCLPIRTKLYENRDGSCFLHPPSC